MPESPLERAIAANDTQRVHALLKLGADPNARGSYGLTPLMMAVGMDNPETVGLIAERCEVNASEDNDATALHYAINAVNGNRIVEILLKAGADPNIPDACGETPLHHAAWGGKAEIALMLLAAGASRAAMSKDNKTPFQLAEQAAAGAHATYGHFDTMGILNESAKQTERPAYTREL
jgi:ankyrin repeat protein